MARTFVTLLCIASVLAAPSPIVPDPSGDKNVGNGVGKQFITGGCLSTADCATPACCAFIAADPSTGICSGIAVADANGKAGCGFGDGGAANATTSATTGSSSNACTSN